MSRSWGVCVLDRAGRPEARVRSRADAPRRSRSETGRVYGADGGHPRPTARPTNVYSGEPFDDRFQDRVARPVPTKPSPGMKRARRKSPLWAKVSIIFGALLVIASGGTLAGGQL